MPFKKLFQPADNSTDGLSQATREAVVDVLHYCMYADKHVAASEDAFIEKAARKLSWDPKISYEYYEGKSTGAVRQALASDTAAEVFFDTLRARLTRDSDREYALRLAEDLAKSDGQQAPQETAAVARLRSALAKVKK